MTVPKRPTLGTGRRGTASCKSGQRERGVMKNDSVRVRNLAVFVLFVVLPAVLAGCAGKQAVYLVPAAVSEKIVPLVATSFDFEPGVIRARQGDVLVLRVENQAGMEHNLTALDPDGKRVLDVVLPVGAVTVARLPLKRVGTYPFYCDKLLHSIFGMKGKIEAAAP